MSSLFGSSGSGMSTPPMTASQPVQVQAGQVETDANNAGIFERMRRAAAYGKQKTMLTPGILPAPMLDRKMLLGSA